MAKAPRKPSAARPKARSPNAAPTLDAHPGEGATRGTQRMEIFADAVFAIAFTLPLVELPMPAAGPYFGAELIALWPAYLGYLLSTLVIGLYWVQHHFAGAIYRTAGHHMLIATMLFLMTIGFIAFPTRAFAEHLHDPAARAAGALFYVWALAAIALAWLIKWHTGIATGDVDDRLDPAYVARLTRRYRITTALTVGAAALALLRWEAGLALAALTLASYARAPETPVYAEEAPTVEGEAD